MQSFQIIKPCTALAPYIRHYWILQDDAVFPVAERVLPVGCMQMVFHKGRQLLSLSESALQPQSFISGQSVGFSDVQSTGKIEMITVVFQPYAVRPLLHIPGYLFHGQNISTDAVEDVELSDLAKRVTDTFDNIACIRLIEQFFIRRLYSFAEYNMRRMSAVFHEIDLQPQISISQMSEVACLSSKQFGRIFADYVGTTPKEMVRIVRMQRALSVLQQNMAAPFVQVAYECGFSDQSHMIKEFSCRIPFRLCSLFRLFFGSLKMSFFSYRDLCGSPTFALSLQRLSSNHKKKNEMKNLIAFFEIPSTDFRRAVDFYETVLETKLSVFECEKEKMACFEEEGETVGAISYSSEFDFLPSEHGVLIHFNCEDIAQILEKVLQKGGKVVIPRTKIEVEGRGWFAVFTDCEGNRIGIYAEK